MNQINRHYEIRRQQRHVRDHQTYFFFINKEYHFRMIFDLDIIDVNFARERFVVENVKNIVKQMKNILVLNDYVSLNRRNIKIVKSFDKLNDKKLNSFKVIRQRDISYE